MHQTITIQGEEMIMAPERLLFWKKFQTLVISDIHLGKGSHFRKEGIAVPSNYDEEQLEAISSLIKKYRCDRIIVAGDLFHSRKNGLNDRFIQWKNQFSSLEIILVKGNHDILPTEWYASAGVTCHEKIFSYPPFTFCHDPEDIPQNAGFAIAGHIHPGIRLKMNPKQSRSFPIFWLKPRRLILPSFSTFSGNFIISPLKEDRVFLLHGESIFEINNHKKIEESNY